MRQRVIYLPELAVIGATRGMLGFGIGVLVANRVKRPHRKIIGTVLLLVGALSTIPLALRVLGRDAIDGDSQAGRRRAETATTKA